MKKRAVVILILALVSFLALVSAHSQEDMEYVDNFAFENPQREPSVFRHEEHNEAAGIEECNECHHVYEDGEKLVDESSEDMYCSDCHSLQPGGDGPVLMKAYHLNCKGCHLQQKKGPIMCGECHVKNG